MAAAGQSPVIIVPGLMGSELWRSPGTDAAVNRVWLNPVALGIGRFVWLQLAPDGASPLPGNPVLAPRNMLWSYYGPLAEQLVALGWSVDAHPYDWRQQIQVGAASLVTRILAASTVVPVHLVCHSLGGLVARVACATLAQQGQLGRVGRIVSLGTPHWGSWAAGGGLSCAYWPTQQLVDVLTRLRLWAIAEVARAALKPVACSWPSLYQLLPSPLAPGVTLPEAIALYGEQEWIDQGAPVSATWMASAFNGWQSLPGLPAGIPWLSIAGQGVATPSGPGLGGITADPTTCPTTDLGDGVVTTRYSYVGPEPLLTLYETHDTLAQASLPVRAVDTWLRGGTPAGTVTSAGGAQPSPVAPPEEIQAAIRRRASWRAQRTSMASSAVGRSPRTYRS